MGQLLYFVPRPDGVDIKREYLTLIGLGERVDFDRGRVNGMVGPAGDDTEGMCFCEEPHGLMYKPDSQTWRSPFADGRYWIGFDREDRPTPGSLARDRLLGDAEVELGDGYMWLIPSPRLAPRMMTVLSDGQVSYSDIEIGERLWRHADRLVVYLDYLKALVAVRTDDAPEPEPPMSDIEMIRIAADGLSVNYRLSPNPAEEISLLGLITTHNVHDVLRAMIALRDPADDGKKNF